MNSNFKHSQLHKYILTLQLAHKHTHCNGIPEKLIKCTLLIKTTALLALFVDEKKSPFVVRSEISSRYKLFQFISTVHTQMTVWTYIVIDRETHRRFGTHRPNDYYSTNAVFADTKASWGGEAHENK